MRRAQSTWILIQDIKEDVGKVYEIAKAFKKGYIIAQGIADCQSKIEKHKEQTLDKDQENLRSEARINALQGRIEVNRSFLTLLDSTQASLVSKVKTYE